MGTGASTAEAADRVRGRDCGPLLADRREAGREAPNRDAAPAVPENDTKHGQNGTLNYWPGSTGAPHAVLGTRNRGVMPEGRLTEEQRRLVEEHVRLAHWAAYHARSHRAYEERLSDATLALTLAALRYDSNRDTAFATYALKRMRGAIQDGNRQAIGRGHYEWWMRREKARNRLLQVVGREPTSMEMARELRMTLGRFEAVEKLDWARRQHANPVEWEHSMVEEVGGLELQEVVRDTRPTAEETAVERADRDVLNRAMCGLLEQQRFVVALIFWEEMPPRDVAELIGVSPSRISQILAAAYKAMRPLVARERAACAA